MCRPLHRQISLRLQSRRGFAYLARRVWTGWNVIAFVLERGCLRGVSQCPALADREHWPKQTWHSHARVVMSGIVFSHAKVIPFNNNALSAFPIKTFCKFKHLFRKKITYFFFWMMDHAALLTAWFEPNDVTSVGLHRVAFGQSMQK